MSRPKVWHSNCSRSGVLELQPTLLQRASEILGGAEALCEYLGVSHARLQLWRAARIRLPDPIFLKAVDLVLRDDIARAAHDRRRHPRDGQAKTVRAAHKLLAL
jgi:hypothetical protein